jgi:neutral ceramidase
MKIGAAQIDITPDPGIDLSGFAARVQPNAGVLDPLCVKCLCLEEGSNRLLLLGADLVAFSSETVAEFRSWAKQDLGIGPAQVLLAATHTHSGPATIPLTGCGTVNIEYLRVLQNKMRQCAKAACLHTEPAELIVVASPLDLAVDRRRKPTAHTDPTVTALAWRRPGGSFIASLVNYAMHPVALGHINRHVSADWCGYAAEKLRSDLPGQPIVMITNGAAGNLNPPGEGLAPDQVKPIGHRVVEGLREKLIAAAPVQPSLRVARELVPMPLDRLEPADIDQYADKWLATIQPGALWEKPFTAAIQTWRRTMKDRVAGSGDHSFEIELFVVKLGPMHMVVVNGEIFSRFTQNLRDATGKPLFVVAYANAAFGYIPTAAAYAEGGYEVETAHFFYNTFRPKIGSLEMLSDRAARLIQGIGTINRE